MNTRPTRRLNPHKNNSPSSGEEELSSISELFDFEESDQELTTARISSKLRKRIQGNKHPLRIQSQSSSGLCQQITSQSERVRRRRNLNQYKQYEEKQEYIEDNESFTEYYHGGKVEKIFDERIRDGTKSVREKLCKLSSRSYLHLQWLTQMEIEMRNIKNKNGSKLTSERHDRYFPESYTRVDLIVSSASMFPILYPKKAQQIKDGWDYILVKILQKLLNFQQYNIAYGVFQEFGEPDISSEKQKEQKFEQMNNRLQNLLSRVYFRQYTDWKSFWIDLHKCLEFLYKKLSQINQQYDLEVLTQCAIFLYWQSYSHLQNNNNAQEKPQIYFRIKDSTEDINEETILKDLLKQNQMQFPKPPSFTETNLDFTWAQYCKETVFFSRIQNEEGDKLYVNLRNLRHSDLMKLNIFSEIDPLYLVKWKDLSYLQSNWQKQSDIIISNGDYGKKKIEEFKVFNKIPNKATRGELESYQRYYDSMLDNRNKPLKNPLQISSVFTPYTLEEPPVYKQYKMLKPFQVESLNWMIQNFKANQNCILADQMGLGKTIQTIAFIHHLFTHENLTGPFLIIVPVSTIKQWMNQITLWSDFNTVVYKGTKEQRQLIEEYLFYYQFVSKEGWLVKKPVMQKFQIFLTNYETLVGAFEIIQAIPFQFIVVDEAHRVKNQNTKLSKTLKMIPCEKILLLTGTPFQNNPNELWGLLNFIQPHTFSSYQQFKRRFGTLTSEEQVKNLQKTLNPYLMRRVKSDVEKSIPKLTQILVTLELTRSQKTYYRGILQQNKNNLLASLNKVQLNNMSICLRKCCNHPYLLSRQVQQEIESQCSLEEQLKRFTDTSCKFQFLYKLFHPKTASTPKTLIFTQFIDTLSLICQFCERFDIIYEFLDGSVPFEERQRRIDSFNDVHQMNPEYVKVFIISTKAGGTGINLTSANCVVIFDSDWNPHNDIQAIARAHRIGQKNSVTVYRLIVGNTYEEVIYKSAVKKLGVGKAVLGDWQEKKEGQASIQQGNDEQLQRKGKQGRPKKKKSVDHEVCQKKKQKKNGTNKDEIQKLLKDGVLGFLNHEENQINMGMENISIEELIANKGKVVNYETKECSFLRTNFKHTSNQPNHDQEELNIDDKNFWEVALKNIESPIQKLVKKIDTSVDKCSTVESQTKLIIECNQIVFRFIKSKIELKGYNAEDQKQLRNSMMKIVESENFNQKFRNIASEWLDQIQKPSRRYEKTKRQNLLKIQEEILRDHKRKQEEILRDHKRKQKEKLKQADHLTHTQPKRQCKKDQPKKQLNGQKVKTKNYMSPQIQSAVLELDPSKDEQLFEQLQIQKQKKILAQLCSVCEQKRCSKYCSKYCKRYFHANCYNHLKNRSSMDQQENIEDAWSDSKVIQSLKNKFQCFQCVLGQCKCFICDNSDEVVPSKKKKLQTLMKKEHTEETKQIEHIYSQITKEKTMKVFGCQYPNCYKYYHLQCLYNVQNELCFEIQEIKTEEQVQSLYFLRCPAHYCAKCMKRIRSLGSSCLRCPVSYHQKCKNSISTVYINEHKFICKSHLSEEQMYLEDLLSGDRKQGTQKSKSTIVSIKNQEKGKGKKQEGSVVEIKGQST